VALERQKSAQRDSVRFLTGLCQGHSQGSTTRNSPTACSTGGVLLVTEIKASLRHTSPWGEDLLGRSTPGPCRARLQRPRPAPGRLNANAALGQQRASAAACLPGRPERPDHSCTDARSCAGAFQLKARLQRQPTRDTKPSSAGHWLRGAADHFTGPGPALLISVGPQKKMGTFLSFLHHPH